MTDSTRQRITTPELLARLQRHYIKPSVPLPGGIFLPEVGWNGGGYGAGGCDAIYVGFTSTSGRILIGHELKVSRADWLNELNKPGKSDPWADQCHEWWLVAADPSIVADGELPAGWGLMVPGSSKTRMQIKQKPDRKPPEHNPSWLAVRSIMARHDTLRSSAIAKARQEARDQAHAGNQDLIDAEIARRMRDIPDAQRLGEQMAQIEQALGGRVDFSDRKWRDQKTIGLDELAAIGKICREHRFLADAVDTLTAGYTIGNLRRTVDQLEQAIANIKAVPGQQMELGA